MPNDKRHGRCKDTTHFNIPCTQCSPPQARNLILDSLLQQCILIRKKKFLWRKLLFDKLGHSRLFSTEERTSRQNREVHLKKQVMDMMSVSGQLLEMAKRLKE